MMDPSICLPFRISGVYAGFAEIRGILKPGKDALILDFEVKESVLDLLRLHSNVVTIPLAEIASVQFQPGWFRHRIIIAVNRLEALRQVPGSRAGELRLIIPRKHARSAGEFVSLLQMTLTTNGLKKLINQME